MPTDDPMPDLFGMVPAPPEPPHRYVIRWDARRVVCRGPDCAADIWWVETETHAMCPVDCDADDDCPPALGRDGRGTSHYLRCPNREMFHRKGAR